MIPEFIHPGAVVAIGRRSYLVVRLGCATGQEDCPHGAEAVTVRREGYTLTECAAAGTLADGNA